MALDRRNFLKLLAVGGLGVSAIGSDIPSSSLSLAVIQGNCDFLTRYEEQAAKTLTQLEDLLSQNGPIDFVLTSENNFDRETTTGDTKTLVLTGSEGGYQVDPATSGDLQEKIAYIQELARRYESNIFPGTFREPGELLGTQLHIDLNGRIVSRKRKRLAEPYDETVFSVRTKSGKRVSSLPLICWEAFYGREVEIDGVTHYGPAAWVKEHEPYDVMLHPKNTPNTNITAVFDLVQMGVTSGKLIDEFRNYYSLYFASLANNSHLLVADRGQMGIFNKQLEPYRDVVQTADYLLVKT